MLPHGREHTSKHDETEKVWTTTPASKRSGRRSPTFKGRSEKERASYGEDPGNSPKTVLGCRATSRVCALRDSICHSVGRVILASEGDYRKQEVGNADTDACMWFPDCCPGGSQHFLKRQCYSITVYRMHWNVGSQGRLMMQLQL